MKNKEYTHGGSAGKNLGLLLRALFNLIAFAALWAGIWMAGNDMPLALPLIIGGGVLCVIGVIWNFIGPIAHAKR